MTVLGQIGLGGHLEFVHTGMTLAHVNPALAQFKDLAEASREQARRTVREMAARTGAFSPS